MRWPEIKFKALSTWPTEPTAKPKRALFSSTSTQTYDLLRDEAAKLDAETLLIEAYFNESDIRRDGLPRHAARASKPGVIVSIQTRKGEWYRYPCDNYDSLMDNIRAIALSLEALRKVNRYGVTKRGEQYRGFKALPAPEAEQNGMTAKEAQNYLCVIAQLPLPFGSSREDVTRLYRMAYRAVDPDRGGTDPDRSRREASAKQVNAAAAVLRRAGWMD